jgi:hypothetical protein
MSSQPDILVIARQRVRICRNCSRPRETSRCIRAQPRVPDDLPLVLQAAVAAHRLLSDAARQSDDHCHR